MCGEHLAYTLHIRKAQPRQQGPNLFGATGLDRRFLWRTYPFFDELGRTGAGLQFLAFMRDPTEQFEFVPQT